MRVFEAASVLRLAPTWQVFLIVAALVLCVARWATSARRLTVLATNKRAVSGNKKLPSLSLSLSLTHSLTLSLSLTLTLYYSRALMVALCQQSV